MTFPSRSTRAGASTLDRARGRGVEWKVRSSVALFVGGFFVLDLVLREVRLDPVLLSVFRALVVAIGAVLASVVVAKNMLAAATRTQLERAVETELLQTADEARRRAEEQLQSTLAQLEGAVVQANDLAVAAEFRQARVGAVMDSVADGVVVFDDNGIIQSCNPAGERIFGVKPGHLLATQLRRRIPSLGTASAHSVSGTREVTGCRVDGTLFPLELTTTTVASDDYPLRIAVVRDVTERRVAETALAEARDAALQAVRVKSEFLATMSHEIRTPMNGVIGMTELLLDTALDAQQQSYTEAVRRSAEALLTIINDILDFSKIEAGKLHIEQVDVDIRQVVEDVVELLGDQAHHKGIELACVVDTAIPHTLVSDPIRLRQILLNLVGNAVKFTEHGAVMVRARVAETRTTSLLVRFEITDTGIGIAADARGRLFAPFVQADHSTTRKYGGTGLGLAICRQLVERMGGEIDVESTKESGSTFWFTVTFGSVGAMAVDSPDAPDAGLRLVVHPASTIHTTPIPRPRTDVGRLLLAEDSTINQAVTIGMLAKLGLTADVVTNGREAVAAVKQNSYAAVLMDCQMPEMDGFEATAEIRQREGTAQHTPIIAMTANAMEGDREHCLAGGMDDYVSKPVRLADFAAALVRCLGAEGGPALEAIRLLPPRLPAHDPFDQETLDALPAGLRVKLLALFFEEVPMQLRRVKAAVLAGDAYALHTAAHAFKGDSSTVGAVVVVGLCRALEQQGRQGNLDGCDRLVVELEEALIRAEAAMPQNERARRAA